MDKSPKLRKNHNIKENQRLLIDNYIYGLKKTSMFIYKI